MLLTTLNKPGKIAWLAIIAAALAAVLAACRGGMQSNPAPLAQPFREGLEQLRQARIKAELEGHTAKLRQHSTTMGPSSKDTLEPATNPG